MVGGCSKVGWPQLNRERPRIPTGRGNGLKTRPVWVRIPPRAPAQWLFCRFTRGLRYRSNTAVVAHSLVQRIGDGDQIVVKQVGVLIQRHDGRGVPQKPLHRLDVGTCRHCLRPLRIWLYVGISLASAEAQFRTAHTPSPPPSFHRLGPRDMPFEAKRSRHVAVAIPDSRDKRRRRREPAPAEPAAATARCRASPDPHRLARPLTARSRPGLRPRHRRSRDRAVSPPEHPSQECPTPAAVPRGPASSTAARMSGMASSRSPRRARSRAKYTSTIGKSPRLFPRRRNISLTSASSCCPRSRSASVGRCTSATPNVNRATTSRGHHRIVRHIRRASSISRTARSSAASTPTCSQEVDPGDGPGVGHGVGAAGHGQAVPLVVAPSGTTQESPGDCPASPRRSPTETRK